MEGHRIKNVSGELFRYKAGSHKELFFAGECLTIFSNNTITEIEKNGDENTYPEKHAMTISRAAIDVISVDFDFGCLKWALQITGTVFSYDWLYGQADKGKLIDDYKKIYEWKYGTFPPEKLLLIIETSGKNEA